MFYNLTAETATLSAGVFTFAGALDERIAFGEAGNVPDGRRVSYVATGDNGQCAGIGTFDKTADTLTQNDTWRHEIGVGVDNNPAANFALTGTIIVRCEAEATNGVSPSFAPVSGRYYAPTVFTQQPGDGTLAADTLYAVPSLTSRAIHISDIKLAIVTAGTATKLRVGIYLVNASNQLVLIAESADQTATEAVPIVASVLASIPAGEFFVGIVADGTLTMRMAGWSTPFTQTSLGATTETWSSGINGYSKTPAASWATMPPLVTPNIKGSNDCPFLVWKIA